MRRPRKSLFVSLPAEWEWMIPLVEHLVEEREEQGVMCSKSQILRELLEVPLTELRKRLNE